MARPRGPGRRPARARSHLHAASAAGELVDRIDALGVDAAVTAGTFHALALAQLRRRATEHGRELPRMLDRKAGCSPRCSGLGPRGTLAVADVATEIEWAKARMIPPERYAAAARAAERRLARSPADLADLYARYEAEKRKRRWLDFDDLLGWCADAIEREDDFAAAQRWRFRHLFVDEFQDADPLQLRLLRAWLGDRPDLCVVGDGAQAIYAFAGADASPLVDFARHFPGGRTVALAYNYRSTDAIVAVAEAALGPASGVERDAPRAVRPADRRAVIHAFDDDIAEADAVADACWKEFTGGVPWHRIGVLFRTNAQSSLFEAALTRRGVPFRVTGAARFAARPAVRALLDRLREADRRTPLRPFTEHLGDLAADVDEERGIEDPGAGATPAPTEAASDEEMRTHRDALLDSDASTSPASTARVPSPASSRGSTSRRGVSRTTIGASIS